MRLSRGFDNVLTCKPMGVATTIFAFALAIGGSLPSHAQSSMSVPIVEDRELYYSFFNYCQGLINTLQTATAASPQNAAVINQQFATMLGIDGRDVPKLITDVSWFMQQSAALAAEKQAALANPSASKLTVSQLTAGFDFKRIRITFETVRLLHADLSSTSWDGFHKYIIGPYRTTVYKH